VRLRELERQWDQLGDRWHALDRARLNKDARVAQQAYFEQRRQVYAVRKAARAAFRDLRAVQERWSEADWQRYRDLLEARIEAGEPPWQSAATLVVAARSAEPPRPGRLRRWYARLRHQA
jgi:hypothetical protein